MLKKLFTICLFLVPVLFPSCREVQSFEPVEPPVSGYEVHGRVTSANGVAIESVAVTLDYDFEIVSATSMDTIPFVEPFPPKQIEIDAFDQFDQYVHHVYSGIVPADSTPRVRWSGIDDNHQQVPSGKYKVRYQLDGSTVKIVPVLIRNTVTAFTDADGNFVIRNTNLPIGQSFDMFGLSSGKFLGVGRLTETVYLTFQRSSLRKSVSATLQVNNVYHGAYTLE